MSKLPIHRDLIEKNNQDLDSFKDDYFKFEKSLFDQQIEGSKSIVNNVLSMSKEIQANFEKVMDNLSKIKKDLQSFVPNSREQRSKM